MSHFTKVPNNKTLPRSLMFQVGCSAELRPPPGEVTGLRAVWKQASLMTATGAVCVSIELFRTGGLNEPIDYHPPAL